MSNVDHNLYGRGGEIRYTGSRCTPGSYYLVRYVSDNMTDDVMKDRREGRKKFEQFGRPIKDVERERGEVTENELDLPRVLPNCACRVYEGFVNVCKDWVEGIVEGDPGDGSNPRLSSEIVTHFNMWMDKLTLLREKQMKEAVCLFGCRVEYETVNELSTDVRVEALMKDIPEELFYDGREWRVLRALLNDQMRENVTTTYSIRCVDGVEVDLGYVRSMYEDVWGDGGYWATVRNRGIESNDSSDKNMIIVREGRLYLGDITIDMKGVC